MRRLAVLLVTLVLVVLVGCSSPSKTPTHGSLPVYLISTETDRLEVVQRAVPSEPPPSGNARAIAAVEALMAVDENGEKHSSLWGRMCGMGTGVTSIESRGSMSGVVVTLKGRGGALCDLSQEAYQLQIQQLVWTVVENLDVPETTAVQVKGPKGYVWVDSATPDTAHLAPGSS